MARPPRPRSEHLLDRPTFGRIAGIGSLEGVAAMASFFFAYVVAGWRPWEALADSGGLYREATTMTMAGIVFAQVGAVMAWRTTRESVRSVGLLANRLILAGIGVEIAMVALLAYVPGIDDIFHTGGLSGWEWLFLLVWPPACARRRGAPQGRRPPQADMTAQAATGGEDGPGAEDEHGAAPPPGGGRLPLGWTIVLMAAAAAVLYLGLPRLAGLDDTWGRLSSGDPRWLAAAALLEVADYAAYVFTFHRLFADPGSRIGWRESYDISLAGVVASRVFATAGAGGIALTVWALDRSGMDRRTLVTRLTSFYVLIYGVFMAALVIFGTGLRTGVLNGPAPFGLTVVPAILGGIAILAALAAARLLPELGART